jgi:hypothetical protein
VVAGDSHGDGDGGSPSLMDWAKMMELALRRIAAGMPTT